MLFHPRQPVRLWRWSVQGILPRRQPDIAVQLGKIVASDLLSSEDLTQQLINTQSRSIYAQFIDSHTEQFIRDKLRKATPVADLMVRSKTLAKIKQAFADELVVQLPALVQSLAKPDSGALDIQQLVESRVREFSTERLEKILYDILAKEFRFIEILGAVLGFVIGLLQLLFIVATR